jgi:hypothetical protein
VINLELGGQRVLRDKLYFIFIFGLTALVSCVLPSTKIAPISKNNLSLSVLQMLKLKETTQSDVLKILGEPNRKAQSIHFPKTAWLYNDPNLKIQRLSVVFDKNERLISVNWEVFDHEKEVDLKSAMAIFPDAQFVAKDAEWINPHIAPDERYYSDSKKGIKIVFRKARAEVELIGWFDPQEKEIERRPATKWIKYMRADGLASIKPANPDDLVW